MAYETGSATDSLDLLSKLSTFCTTFCGYTETATVGTTKDDTELYLTKNSKTFMFLCTDSYPNLSGTYDTTEGIHMFVLSGAYAGGTDGYDQAGVPPLAAKYSDDYIPLTKFTSGSITEYHFFYDGNIVAFVFKTSYDLWVHSAFGFANKLTAFSGDGAFVASDNFYSNAAGWDQADLCLNCDNGYASFLCSHANDGNNGTGVNLQIHVEDGGAGHYFMNFTQGSYTTTTEMDGYAATNNAMIMDGHPEYFAPDAMKALGSYNYNGANIILQPTFIYVENTTTRNKYHLYADLPSIRATNMGPLTAGSEVTYNSGTWKVFPAKRKTNTWYTNDDLINTYLLGWAYKKVI